MAVPHLPIGFPHAVYSLLGINNRDLKTMTTDISRTLRLIDILDEEDVDTSVIVNDSGIKTPEDLARLRQRGINIALVGEYLLREDDPGAVLRALLGA